MKWALRGILAVILLLLVGSGGFYFWLRGSLAKVDGDVRVNGPAAAIEIVRDRYAVPHIYGQSLTDATYGLGYAHAQDRLWQMEMNRRIGAGRLAEVLGEAALPTDRFLRTLDLYGHAERTYAKLDQQTQEVLDAYAAGVNAFLQNRSGRPLPPEFLILRVAPAPWRPADSLVWSKVMALDLAGNWTRELMRLRLTRRLSLEQIDALYAPYRTDAPRGVTAFNALYRSFSPQRLDRIYAAAYLPLGQGAGSNNWVVDGTRTASGKPLLANDPHLGLQAPSVWYLAHLSWQGRDVIGASMPGLPLIVIGRNNRISWGLTDTGPDVQDLYIERIDPADREKYITPKGSRPFEKRREVIKVKNAPDVSLDVRSTRHGPVISDIDRRAAESAPEGHLLALQWTALTDDDLTVQAGLKVMQAGNWPEFTAALKDYHSPQQNIVYADVDGNVGYYAPGRVPVRSPQNDLNGYMPQPGWDARYDWKGFIPFAKLPHSFAPAGGTIATANHKVVPDDYAYHLTYEWADGYRAQRIFSLLGARSKHSVESFKAMQMDVVSPMARDLLPRLLQAAPRSENARALHKLLSAWDYRMDRLFAEPLVFAAWYRELTRAVYADELGDLFTDAWGLRARFIRSALMGEQQAWCDNITTQPVETCDDAIARALDNAYAWLAERYGEDPAQWRWGDVHIARSEHRPFSDVDFLRGFFEIEMSSAGGAFTINVGHYRISATDEPFANVHAPSLRTIIDLRDPNRSLFIHATGQSGNPLSDYYKNFALAWRDGDYIPMTTLRQDIDVGRLGVLTLQPSTP